LDEIESEGLHHPMQDSDTNATPLTDPSPSSVTSEPTTPVGQPGNDQYGSTSERVLDATPSSAARLVGQREVHSGSNGSSVVRPLHILNGVEMTVSVELGRTRMLVKDLLSLGPGSLVELDRPTGSPVDILVNGTLLAHGEVVVVDDEFGVRVTDVVGSNDHEEQSLTGFGNSGS